MYTKEFEVRWSDLDSNKHMANSAYLNMMSHTRMAFLFDQGFSPEKMKHYNIGPVMFYEHLYYFREILQGESVTVSLEVTGISENGSFFAFNHNIYNNEGKHAAHCEMLGAWLDLNTRKIISPDKDLISFIKQFPKSENFKILTKEDTRKFNKKPVDLK